MTDLFEKFDPKNYEKTLFNSFNDVDINEIVEQRKNLSKNNKNVFEKIDSIKNLLKKEDISRLKLIKLLYCLKYNSETFLNIGRLIEKYLNDVVNYYMDNSIEHNQIPSFRNIIKNFENRTLFEKSDSILSADLFENKSTNNYIAGKIKALTTLRNYGGHFKNIEFFENIFCNQEKFDKELIDAFDLIIDIINAFNIVQNNHINEIP